MIFWGTPGLVKSVDKETVSLERNFRARTFIANGSGIKYQFRSLYDVFTTPAD